MECHFTPDQVFGMPWMALVRLTLVSDEMQDQARTAKSQQALAAARKPQRMV